jgi:transcriptional regulator GlxA family with amidase domain
VRLTGSMPVTEAANQQLAAAMDHVRDTVVANPRIAQNPFIAGTAQRYLAASMLATYPNTALLEPTIEDRHDSTPVLLRRAIAFIEDSAHTDITVVDIAKAVYVTPRALQYMFRKHRDCTPMEYVRRVRLHYAHLDLVAGNRFTTTVGDIARRWGFGHLGRFAVSYREAYGESPHITLRR